MIKKSARMVSLTEKIFPINGDPVEELVLRLIEFVTQEEGDETLSSSDLDQLHQDVQKLFNKWIKKAQKNRD